MLSQETACTLIVDLCECVPDGSARVVAGREDDSSVGLCRSDDSADARRRHDCILSGDDLLDSVRCGHAHDHDGRVLVVVAAVSAEHQRAARQLRRGEAVKNALHEVLKVVRLLHLLHLHTREQSVDSENVR